MNTLKIENPYQHGAEWGIKTLEDGTKVILNPNNVLRGFVAIDEVGGVNIEGPLVTEAERHQDFTIVQRVTELVAQEIEGRKN